MRGSQRLHLDVEVFVPVTRADPAELNGEDTVNYDYGPLELIFSKNWDLPPGSLLHLVAFQHPSALGLVSKEII